MDLKGNDPLGRLEELREEGVRIANEVTSKQLIQAWGVRVPPGLVVENSDQVQSAWEVLNSPVILKVVRTDMAHKSDVDGVRGPFYRLDEVVVHTREMLSKHDDVEGVLVESWYDSGVPCFLSLTLSGPYAPIVSFGLGGIWVEALRDVSHRLAPINHQEAFEMIRSLRAYPVLRGERGTSGVDLSELTATIVAISEVANNSRLGSVVDHIELNPLQGFPDMPPVALDCKVFLFER